MTRLIDSSRRRYDQAPDLGPRDAVAGPPLLVFADDWGRHPSSPQHLIRRLRHDHPILWVNTIGTRRVAANAVTIRRVMEKVRGWRNGLTRVGDRMWVVDLPMLPGLGNPLLFRLNRGLVTRRLRGILGGLRMSEPVLLTTLPYVHGLTRDLPRRATIYYCTDDYSHWPGADRAMLQRWDRELARHADLLLPVSRSLHSRHESTGRCRYFPHGVDLEHFARAADPAASADLPPEIRHLPGPRIGFFGLIYEKLDFELLAAVARSNPAGSLILIGSVVHCPEGFAELPNVHLLGPRPYEELPTYLAGLDALLLPYLADDPMIRQSSPLKLRECLATGKPTISVDVPEVHSLRPHVRVAADRGDFIAQMWEALRGASDPEAAESRRRAVAADSWDSRAAELRRVIQEYATRPDDGSHPPLREA
jgi:glycosyltransferase involved in cell wall biosynthesis